MAGLSSEVVEICVIDYLIKRGSNSSFDEILYKTGLYIIEVGNLHFVNEEEVDCGTKFGIFSFKKVKKSRAILKIND